MAHRPTRWTARNSAGYDSPAALTVDAVVLAVRDAELAVLVVRRPDGAIALPGGFVAAGQHPDQAVRATLDQKTGLGDVYLEQLATFADPDRDPRGWIPTIAYLALVPATTDPADPDAEWMPLGRRRPLAFDHDAILDTALDRVRGKLWWSNVAVGLLPTAFSMSQAREVYEAITGLAYDPATFARDLRATGLVEATGDQRREGPGRPAATYRFKSRSLEWGAGRRKRLA